jgi:hypothetical protein
MEIAFRFLALFTFVWLLAAGTVSGQELVPPSPPADYPSLEQLMARLERAETTLRIMQEQQLAPVSAQGGNDEEPPESEEADEPKWYEKLSLRGYGQVRFNEVTRLAPGSAPAHHVGDRSVGEDESFLIRRARIAISGDVSDHLGILVQADFANTPPGSSDATYFTVIRDWWADCYIDTDKVHRIRIGQQKLPYGWENMQSSSNRIPLDRSDAINTAVRNERDLGIFYYWTPEPAQEFFDNVLDWGLKGSGNYGVFGCGIYNGQGGSLMEQNDNLHFLARFTLPYTFESGQMMEIGVQGYTGVFTVLSSPISPLGVGPAVRPLGTLENGNPRGLIDRRVAGTFVWYPQPFGIQAEWNVGEGPALNEAQTEVTVRSLRGGYVMCIYKYDSPCYGTFYPFARYATYRGGYKQERNAPYAHIDEFDFGVEWQFAEKMEVVAMYVFTDRTNTTAINAADTRSYGQFEGQLARFQFQFSY